MKNCHAVWRELKAFAFEIIFKKVLSFFDQIVQQAVFYTAFRQGGFYPILIIGEKDCRKDGIAEQ